MRRVKDNLITAAWVIFLGAVIVNGIYEIVTDFAGGH